MPDEFDYYGLTEDEYIDQVLNYNPREYYTLQDACCKNREKIKATNAAA